VKVKFSKNVLVTGGTGFVGRALVQRLYHDVKCGLLVAVRYQSQRTRLPAGVQIVDVGDIGSNTSWSRALKNISVVIHTVARAHVMNETIEDPLKEYRRVNVSATLNLAQQAAEAGIRRFIYISSIKVNGESTVTGHLFTPEDVPAPIDPYGISKLEAEIGLRKISEETGLEVVIIRPPLVYGPNTAGNFNRLLRVVASGMPIPLGAIQNQRSLVSLDNLVDLIVVCIDHPAAANQIFLAGDGEDISTPELLKRLGAALDKPVRLISLPEPILTFGANILGKRAMAQRLCGSLQVDISKTRHLLGWNPPLSVDEGLEKTARAFLSDKN